MDMFDIGSFLLQLLFYILAIYSIVFAWVAYRKFKNWGFIFIALFFLVDIFENANFSIRHFLKQKEIQNSTFIKQSHSTRTQTEVHHYYNFPLGELLLLGALYKLTSTKENNKLNNEESTTKNTI